MRKFQHTAARRRLAVQNQVDVLGLKEGSPANLARRKKIDQIARGYNNNKAWCFDCKKDNFGVGTNKCNKYVYDVTKEAGATGEITIKGTKRAPLAAEWADKNTQIKNWRVLKDGETPLPGDVAAYKLEGGGARFSGHTGLMISNGSGGLTNISAHGDAVYPTPCISELPYHSNKPPGRHPNPTKAHNRCVAQGAAGQPIDTTGQLPDNTTECKAGL